MRYAVHEYGCLTPIAGEEAALEQMRRRIEFWNALVSIEQEHIARTREVLSVAGVDDRIASLGAEISDLHSRMKAGRTAQSASAAADRRDLRSRIDELRIALKAAILESKRLRPKLVEERRAALSELDIQRKQAVKAARASAHLYWCNADEVIALYEDARIRSMKKGTTVGFRAWRGSGTVSVKYQRGLLPSALGSDTRFQIDPVDPRAWSDPSRSVRRRLARTVARIRVGSTEKRHPVWLELPVILHRPLPQDALIRAVRVKRFRIGYQFHYKVMITVRLPDAIPPSGRTRSEAAGIWIDCHEMSEGIRVGYWAAADGEHGEVLLPAAVVSEFEKLGDLQGILDRNWNETRAALVSWLGSAAVPDWLRNTAGDLVEWMDYYRPLHLADAWSEHRFAGDEQIFARLVEWKRKHLHLHSWASHLRDQVQKRRREHYRLLAAQLAKNYDRIYINAVASAPATERDEPDLGVRGVGTREAHIRTIAAPSILRRTVLQTSEREAVKVTAVDFGRLAPLCPACGGTTSEPTPDAPMSVFCRSCSRKLDRGLAMALAILNLGQQLSRRG